MRLDLRHRRFGNLVALTPTIERTGGSVMWLCVCDCGRVKTVSARHLMDGGAKSCGCEQGRHTHGLSSSRLYRTWHHMIERCDNPNDSSWSRYGGRGISVCKEWMIFENFLVWAKSSGYLDSLTIDREDNNGNYTPKNCRWITARENSQNRNDIKINTRRIRLIRTGRRNGLSLKKLASMFRISESEVSRIANLKVWENVA